MDVQILGPLRVLRDGAELDLGRRKQRLLLAVLATAGGETVSVDRLADELWGERPPPRAAASIQAYVSKLRQVLEPDRPPRTVPTVLVTRPPGYALCLAADQLDATRFAALAEEAGRQLREGRLEEAHDTAGAALALWRGDVLADLADEPVAVRERPRWQELRVAVTEDRLHAAVGLGRLAAAIADLDRLLADHPLRERTLALLMRALYLAGRPTEALDRYRRHQERLRDELGLDPGPELQALEGAILRQEPALDPVVPGAGARPRIEVRGPESVGLPPSGAPASAPDVTAPSDAGLVGRDAELAAADRLLAEVRAGRPGWSVVSGEPGIGKTRLAEAVAGRATAQGIEVGWGRCHEDGDAPAYWPWSQLLRAVVGDAGDPIADLLASSGDLPLDADARRYRLHERVAELLLAEGPRLVVLDDLQWADAASLQLLDFLAVQVRAGGLGVVLTVRSGVDRPELRHTLATLARHPGASHRVLPPLDVAELATLAAAVTGAPLGSDVAARLHRRTAGNPFFATELLRLPAAPGAGADPLPEAVRDVIERRLAPLGAEVRAVLDLAAVIGVTVDLTLLEAAGGTDPDAVFDAIDLAVATGILLTGDEPGSAVRFAHGLVRDTLLAGLSPMRRQRLHARVAAALQTRPRPDPARQTAELAHHLTAAVALVGVDAAHAAVADAARSAEDRLAFDEAATWWRTAGELLDRHDAGPEQVEEDLVAAGRALLLAGRPAEGRETLGAAIDRAMARGDPVGAAAAAVVIGESGGAWYWVDPGETPTAVVARLEAVLDALGPADHPLRVELLGVLAPGVYYTEPARAGALVRQALAAARRLDDRRVLGNALFSAMGCEWGPTTGARHLELSDELLSLPEEVRSPVVEVAARLWRANAYLERGELARGDREIDAATAVAGASRRQVLQAQTAIARVGQAWLVGDLAGVEAAIDRAHAVHERSGLYQADAARLANRSVVRLLQGRLDEVADDLPVLFEVGFGRSTFEAYAHLGRGDLKAAAATLARRDARPLADTWQWLPARVLRALAAVECDADQVAASLRAELLPFRDQIAVAGMCMTALGPVSLHTGALAATTGDLAAAEADLGAAVGCCDTAGLPLWGALARCRLGEVLARGGRHAEAAATLDVATSAARRLGLGRAADRAERVLASA